MPVAKIHVHEGAFSESELAELGLAVQAGLEEVLGIPAFPLAKGWRSALR